jgi:ribose transport system permease protein
MSPAGAPPRRLFRRGYPLAGLLRSPDLLRQAPILLPYTILLILIVVYVRLQPNAFTLDTLNTTAAATLPLLLVAAGQTIVILRGGIDLSVGGVISLATALAATQFGNGGGHMFGWMAIIALLGLAAGALNGVLLGTLRLQPFIVTLATWSIWGGVALWILPTVGGRIPNSFVSWAGGTRFGLATPVWLMILLILIWLWFKRTRLGFAIVASGSSPRASYLSGVPMLRTMVATYALAGLFAALAGIFLTTQTASGSPTIGNDYILSSVAATVIGGTSLFGGRGGVGGTIAGAFILTMIGNVIFALQLSSFWTPVMSGALLILAVLANSAIQLYTSRQVYR